MNSENYRHTRLQKLSGSDFEISDGDSDIRGWDVKDSAGKRIGKVDELIFDYESRKVRYLVVDVAKNDYGIEDRDVLIPIGVAELHESADDVILSTITSEQLNALPEYDEDRFDTEHESSIRNVFGGLSAGGTTSDSDKFDDFYDHQHFSLDNLYRNRQRNRAANDETTIPLIEEELQVGKREVETGGIRLRSRIVEQDVSEDINLRNETVRVERTDVDRPATANDLREEDIEMREYKEVPVVNKEARVTEEIRLNKEVNERTETINDTVRKTEVDIDEVKNRKD